MLRRIVTTFAITLISLFAIGGAVSAAPDPLYPSPGNVTINLTINNLTVNFVFINSTVTINGSGFLPFEAIDISVAWAPLPALHSSPALVERAEADKAAATADAAGNFSANLTFDRTGIATVTATGGSGRVAANPWVPVAP